MSVLSEPYAERDGSEMTAYDGFAVEYRDASHRYWIHITPSEEARLRGELAERIPATSVTTALKILDKPALISWAERCGVEGALRLERAGELKDVPVEQATEIVRINGMGSDAKRDAGADRGTAVHEAIRAYCDEGKVPRLADFPAEVRPYVSACSHWLMQAKPNVLESEVVVGHPVHKYAGRVDMIAELDGRIVLVDFKTSPAGRVYDEAHVQTAGYLLALPECGIENVDGAVIVAFGEEGAFEEVPCEADGKDFLSVLDTSRRMGRIKNARAARERAAKKEQA